MYSPPVQDGSWRFLEQKNGDKLAKGRFKVTQEPLAQGGMQPLRKAPPREVHLRDLAFVVLRHWLLVVLLAGLVGTGAYYAGRRTMPQYQS